MKEFIEKLTDENYKLLTENLIGASDFCQAKENLNTEFLKSQKISKVNFNKTLELLSSNGYIDLKVLHLLTSHN